MHCYSTTISCIGTPEVRPEITFRIKPQNLYIKYYLEIMIIIFDLNLAGRNPNNPFLAPKDTEST